jgi:alpha-tubulin suppressor-like RCC1 family protein
MIAALFLKLKGWLIGALLAIIALFSLYAKGRKDGKNVAQQDQREEDLETIQETNDVKQEIESAPPGDAAKRLRDDWQRD